MLKQINVIELDLCAMGRTVLFSGWFHIPLAYRYCWHTTQVNEMPGTYLYHDHSNHNRGDGLQGALIVNERPGTAKLIESDADETLFLSDWWHFAGNAMALRLNRYAAMSAAWHTANADCLQRQGLAQHHI